MIENTSHQSGFFSGSLATTSGSVNYFEHPSRNGALYLAPESLPALTTTQLHSLALQLEELESKLARGRARYAACAVQESIWDSETNNTHS